jgi:hypothetical protein
MRKAFIFLPFLLALSSCGLFQKEPLSCDNMALNHIQVLGSHNSYKDIIQPELLELIAEEDSQLAMALDYVHAPLWDQLDMGLRQLELDVFHDPEGGRYQNPYGEIILDSLGIGLLPYDKHEKLEFGGFKVFHIQDIDFRSHCLLFQDCLHAIYQWSENHKNHLPILITINPKHSGISRGGIPFTKPLDFDKEALDSLDLEILDVFIGDKLIRPDAVRGKYQSLEEAVLKKGWPKLADSRGKVIIALDASANGEIIQTYLKDHPSLKDRAMFVNSEPGHAEAAFRIMNDPISQLEEIQQSVKAGYLVRTRADANTKEAREGDYSRLQAAQKSGAQYISTDYYLPDPRIGSGYQVRIDEGFQRLNPLFEIQDCVGFKLE